ncbi:MAG: nuclear transport factor 2 family protein [Gemmatimonadales bacterium]
MTYPVSPGIAPRAADAPPAFGLSPAPHAPERELANLELTRRYLAAIEQSTSGGSDAGPGAAAFLAPDVVQEEFPNLFVPTGAKRDLAALEDAAARGRKVLSGQRYEVRHAHAAGDTVILEVLWVGTLAVPVRSLAEGAEMRAHFAVVLEIRDGKIRRQRNYDCFEPWPDAS